MSLPLHGVHTQLRVLAIPVVGDVLLLLPFLEHLLQVVQVLIGGASLRSLPVWGHLLLLQGAVTRPVLTHVRVHGGSLLFKVA